MMNRTEKQILNEGLNMKTGESTWKWGAAHTPCVLALGLAAPIPVLFLACTPGRASEDSPGVPLQSMWETKASA